MQIVQTKSHIVEKTLRDKEGRLIRARFCVYESAGRIKARLVEVAYLPEKAHQITLFALSGFSKKETWTRSVQVGKKVVSPYFKSNSLYFSGSKPRAPTSKM
ncbi:MAG: hypothetical protein UT81_C0013G0020 [Parcubacteria group bacterium GW2011_GWA2_40_14]|nr:MAG: hypothetical protein UT81_C0013G0020 [Parcubacteria group bacterium GW2011_GWA2_40_14]